MKFKKLRTIPLSKHRRIRTNVLFQKFATNFVLLIEHKKILGTIMLSNIGAVTK